MAQDSFPWGCTPEVGDFGPVTVNDLVNSNQFIGNTNPNEEGVIYWTSPNPLPGGVVAVDGLLATSLVGSVVSVATGIGMVQGWHFVNDAVVSFDFAADAGNASATDLIVLERGNPATELTVRLARVKGAASTVATVTQSETLWQVAIARVPLNASGLPTSVVDVRRVGGGQVMSWRQGGSATNWLTAGTTNYTVGNVEQIVGSTNATITTGGSNVAFTVTLPFSFAQNPFLILSLTSASLTSKPYGVYPSPITPPLNELSIIVVIADGTTAPSDIDLRVSWLAIGIR